MAQDADMALVRQEQASPTRRYRVMGICLAVLVVCIVLVSVCIGRYPVSPGVLAQILAASAAEALDALRGVFGASALVADGSYYDGIDASAYTAVMQVRLPRVIVCAFVGAALSIAGASYQGLFQNPMCSQDVLGASSGAAFGAALAIYLSLGHALVSGFAFAFGIVAVLISYAISRMSKSSPILALILAGMVVSSLFSSGTSTIKLVADTEDTLPAITYWLMGSLASVRMSDVVPTIVPIIAAATPIVLLRWRINLLATGEEEAKSLGMNTNAMRLVVIVCATFLTATCVAVSGLIGWVGLVIPHFCRMLFGQDYRRIIPSCIVMGAGFLVLVDDIARMATTSEIPIGILTAFVGAPIFMYLIVKGGARHGSGA